LGGAGPCHCRTVGALGADRSRQARLGQGRTDLDPRCGRGLGRVLGDLVGHQPPGSLDADRPKNVNQIALAFTADRGVGDRFETLDGDLHTVDFGTAEHEVGIYSHIAQMETPADNVAIFRKFRRALKPGGTLVINDFVVNDERSGPPFPLLFASEMLLHTMQGASWRESDYRVWLAEAGFTDITFHPTPSPATLVFAR
jgi:hypothetical protein